MGREQPQVDRGWADLLRCAAALDHAPWDAEHHFSHPPSPQEVEEAWNKHPDASGALVVSPSPYSTCADIAGLIDVSATGTSGYQAADWLRANAHIDLGMSDHRRILATLSMADDKETLGRLTDAMRAWRTAANDFEPAPRIALPSPADLQLETVELPRDAFFGQVEAIPTQSAGGRIAAEQITPYPPGIPAVVPGERLNDAVLDYLCSGVNAGMNLPDAADQSLQTIRVLA